MSAGGLYRLRPIVDRRDGMPMPMKVAYRFVATNGKLPSFSLPITAFEDI